MMDSYGNHEDLVAKLWPCLTLTSLDLGHQLLQLMVASANGSHGDPAACHVAWDTGRESASATTRDRSTEAYHAWAVEWNSNPAGIRSVPVYKAYFFECFMLLFLWRKVIVETLRFYPWFIDCVFLFQGLATPPFTLLIFEVLDFNHDFVTLCCIVISVDGNWGSWLSWSQCSLSCGGGIRSRQRRCDNPRPQFGGTECMGSETQRDYCNNDPCPGKQ